jgi:protein-tyrosine phosphatase
MAERSAFWLLDHQWVHFLATDAHDIQSRPPRLRPAFDLVAEQYDLATAERLCIANPRAAFYGEPLGLQPEPIAADAVDSRRRPTTKSGFFGRLFGR